MVEKQEDLFSGNESTLVAMDKTAEILHKV